MRATLRARLERLEKIIEQLSYESERGNPIIVEGPKDKSALRAIGIEGSIMCLQSSRLSPLEFVEALGNLREAIILTDFDRQGVALAHKLSRSLNTRGTIGNITLWRSLRELTRSYLRSVEELPGYHERLKLESENSGNVFRNEIKRRHESKRSQR